MAIEDVKNKPGPFVFEHQLKAKKQIMVEAAPPIADGFNDMAPPNLNLKKDGPPPPPPPPPQKGALPVIFNAAGAFQTVGNLSFTDPAFKIGFTTKRCRVFAAQFNVGEEYQLDLRHNLNNVDPYLILLDDKGIILAQDDDSGGNLNSRIIHRAKYTGVHRIYVTSLNGIDTGPYSFSVRRIGFAPVVKNEPPPVAVAIDGVNHRVIDFKKGERLLDGLIWASDGKSFFVLNQNGLLQHINVATGAMEKQNDFARRCGNLALSGEGLLLSVLDAQEVWIVDPDNLADVKRKIRVPGLTRVSAGHDAKLAVAGGAGGFGGDLYLLDLQRDTYVKQHKLASQHLVVSPDGKYAFAQGGVEQLQRFRIEPDGIVLEDSTPRIAQNGARICISPDSKHVALPSGGGNYKAAGHPPAGSYATYVYPVENLKRPDVVISSGAYPRAIGFDSKSGMILAQNHSNALILFTYTGVKRSEHSFPGFSANDLHEISVSPLGFEALLRGNHQIVHVTLKK